MHPRPACLLTTRGTAPHPNSKGEHTDPLAQPRQFNLCFWAYYVLKAASGRVDSGTGSAPKEETSCISPCQRKKTKQKVIIL